MTPPPAVETYYTRLLDPRLRGYLVTLVAALAVVAVALFQRGQLLAAVVPLFLALPGLLFRWTGIPALVVLAICYLLAFPTGIPLDQAAFAQVRTSHLEVTDLLFVSAVLCYLAAQYRLFALTVRAVPADRPRQYVRQTDPELRRPADTVTEVEIQWVFGGIMAAVLGGQLLWLGLTDLDVDLTQFPPVQPVQPAPTGVSTLPSRFVLFAAFFGGIAVVARLVFWYWRLHRLNGDEGRLVLTDIGWAETRRETARQETWRAWGRPGSRTGDRLSFWAGLRAPLLTLLCLAAIAFVLRIVWVIAMTRL
jgi:hypothetical protein